MIIDWSDLALDDLAGLRAYIAKDNPSAARETALTIVTSVKTLAHNPEIGRPGRVPGTRELVIARSPYIVPYRLRGGSIQILRVYHGARHWPDRF